MTSAGSGHCRFTDCGTAGRRSATGALASLALRQWHRGRPALRSGNATTGVRLPSARD